MNSAVISLNKRLFILHICISISAIATNAIAQNKQKKVLFVIADGIPRDVVKKVNTPNLDAIVKEGKFLDAYVGGEKDGYSQTPTISAVGYNSLLTGTWVNKHNVWDNNIKQPNYNYLNIFRLFKNQYPDKKTAIFSSWTDNRTKLVGDSVNEAGNVKIDYQYDGYELDTINFPHDHARDFMHKIDETVVDAATACVKNKAPDLSWVYLEYTDDMGHMYGDSDRFYKAVEMMDAQIGQIWEAIQYRKRQFKEDWLIVITTDHVRDAKTGKGHGGQSDRERNTWIVTNYRDLNSYALNSNVAIVDIMPTIARYLDVQIPKGEAAEIDGGPLIGKVSLANVKLEPTQGKMQILWEALDKEGKVKIWASTSNNFKTGKPDKYELLTEIPISKERVSIDLAKGKQSFYKVVVEGKYNTANHCIKITATNSALEKLILNVKIINELPGKLSYKLMKDKKFKYLEDLFDIKEEINI